MLNPTANASPTLSFSFRPPTFLISTPAGHARPSHLFIQNFPLLPICPVQLIALTLVFFLSPTTRPTTPTMPTTISDDSAGRFPQAWTVDRNPFQLHFPQANVPLPYVGTNPGPSVSQRSWSQIIPCQMLKKFDLVTDYPLGKLLLWSFCHSSHNLDLSRI